MAEDQTMVLAGPAVDRLIKELADRGVVTFLSHAAIMDEEKASPDKGSGVITVTGGGDKRLVYSKGSGEIYSVILYWTGGGDVQLSFVTDSAREDGNADTIGVIQSRTEALPQKWYFTRFDDTNDVYVALITPNPPLPFFTEFSLTVNNRESGDIIVQEAKVIFKRYLGDKDR